MRHIKHNQKLCSVIGSVFARPKSKISQLKVANFSWPLLFSGVFLLLFVLGFLPIQLLVKNLLANYNKVETIKLYANNVMQDKEPGTYEEGWWNMNLATLSPQASTSALLKDFDDTNSSFYTGGHYSLSFSDFKFLQEEVGSAQADEPSSPAATGTAVEVMDSQPVQAPQNENAGSDTASTSAQDQTGNGEVQILNESEMPDAIDSASSSEEGATDAKSVSFGRQVGDIFRTSPAYAEEMIASRVDKLSDLGEFRSARIRFSLAMNEIPKNKKEALMMIDSASPSPDTEASSSPETETATATPEKAGDAANAADESAAPAEEQKCELLNLDDTNQSVEVIGNSGGAESGTDSSYQVVPEASLDTPEPAAEEPLSLFDFVHEARAQAENRDAKFIIWYAFASSSDAEGEDSVWHQLDTIGGQALANGFNKDYFSFDAPFIEDWSQIGNLKLKLEALKSNHDYIAYLDSVWVEAQYEPSALVEKINKRKEWEKALKMLSDKKDFRMDEHGMMRFHYQKNRETIISNVGKFLGLSDYWSDVSIRPVLVDWQGKELEASMPLILGEEGDFSVSLPDMPRGFRPGKYSVRFYIDDSSDGENGGVFIDQDFNWGVLAANTDKAAYSAKDDSAFFQFAVLNEQGHTLCDAELSLDISTPDGSHAVLSTENGQIVRNPDCGPDNVISMPDYYATFMIDQTGDYSYTLLATTTNGVYSISDKFSKTEIVPFDVARTAPTRIFPLADYKMAVDITANQDFFGEIDDFVPAGFRIVNEKVSIKKASATDFVAYDEAASSSEGKMEYAESADKIERKLAWKNIELAKGDSLKLAYQFDAPDVSPEFYLLGKLKISDYEEARFWQIASDALAVSTSTNGSNVGWTNAANAWDNGVNTYANRTILRKTGTGETASYIQSTSNSTVNLGGKITAVEIGIEGYVAATTITAYLIPYFNGSSAGTTYTINGTTMGTSDNDTTKYVTITNSTGAPSTWTWADVQNLDVRVYGGNSSTNSDNAFYIDQIRIRVTYTPNTLPDTSFVSASARKDGSGVADVSIQVSDIDADDCKGKIEYVAGSSCNFASPLSATIDETDANATSSSTVDPKVSNANAYQVGNASGWINTSQGANTVSFDWLSASNTNGTEGVYCLRATANDQQGDDATPATTTLMIDNKAPVAPGNFKGASSTKNSITLYYGSAASDLNFLEYRIYYSLTSTVDEGSTLFASTSDPNLAQAGLNGKATTTIGGLQEGKTYYFALWAYDSYGHKASTTVFSFATNITPNSVFNALSPAQQKTNGSGVADIAIDVFDFDHDLSRARLDYVAGAGCDFTTPLKPTLDETPANISYSYGNTSISNGNVYQIGNASGWISTPATNTVSFDWQTKADIPNADGTYCLRLTANDQKDDQHAPVFTTLTVDNLAPTAPGNLTFVSKSTSTIVLHFNAPTVESHFAYYKMFYKIGTSGVTTGNTEHADTNLGNQYYNNAPTTTLKDLQPNTDYVINIWAYDAYGNVTGASEVTYKTDASILNYSLTLANPVTANWVVGDGTTAYTFQAVVSEGNGWHTLNDVKLRLANSKDTSAPYTDLEFTWNETSNSFTETGTDQDSVVSLSPSSAAVCSGNDCTINFNLVFKNNFSQSSTNYAASLYSTNDSAVADQDDYANFYQVKIVKVEQAHYRWRNDNGWE